MNQKIRTSVFSVVSLKIPQMGESPKKYLEKILKSRNSEKSIWALHQRSYSSSAVGIAASVYGCRDSSECVWL